MNRSEKLKLGSKPLDGQVACLSQSADMLRRSCSFPRLSLWRQCVWVCNRSITLMFFFVLTSSVAQAQFGERPLPESPNLELTQAREKAKSAKKKYDTLKKLSQRGSASQKELRDAKLLKALAMLELSNLVSPELEERNLLMRESLIFNYRNQELKVIKSLYQRGSASQLDFQRAKTAQEVAQSRLKAARSVSQAQRKIQIIKAANSRLESAQKEHQLAKKLLKTGSISQSEMDRASSNLEIAKSGLAEAKKSLGAKAVQVKQ